MGSDRAAYTRPVDRVVVDHDLEGDAGFLHEALDVVRFPHRRRPPRPAGPRSASSWCKPLQGRHLDPARRAPGRPEVEQHVAARVVVQRAGSARPSPKARRGRAPPCGPARIPGPPIVSRTDLAGVRGGPGRRGVRPRAQSAASITPGPGPGGSPRSEQAEQRQRKAPRPGSRPPAFPAPPMGT